MGRFTAMRNVSPFLCVPCLLLVAPGCSGGGESGSDTGDAVDSQGETGDALGPQWDCDQDFWAEGLADEDGVNTLVLDSESAVTHFCTAYNKVDGALRVELGAENDSIMTLDGIACLCEVTGDFEIFYLGYEDSSAGGGGGRAGPPPPHASLDLELDNLRKVGGDFRVHHVPGITSIEGVYQLEEVEGDLLLDTNPLVASVVMESLVRVGGEIALDHLENLQAFSAPRLETVGGFRLGDWESGSWHGQFQFLGLGALTTVGENFLISAVPVLETLKAESLASVAGAFHLEAGCQLSLDFPQLSSVGSLQILGVCGLEDFSGLSALSEITGEHEGYSLHVSHNNELSAQELEAFSASLNLQGESLLQSGETAGCGEFLLGNYGRDPADICL